MHGQSRKLQGIVAAIPKENAKTRRYENANRTNGITTEARRHGEVRRPVGQCRHRHWSDLSIRFLLWSSPCLRVSVVIPVRVFALSRFRVLFVPFAFFRREIISG